MAHTKVLTRQEVLTYLKSQYLESDISASEVTAQMLAKEIDVCEETARQFLKAKVKSGIMYDREAIVNGHFSKVYGLLEGEMK